MIKDMTKGDPLKLILLFSVPLLIGNIFQQLYNLSDVVIVGRLLGLSIIMAFAIHFFGADIIKIFAGSAHPEVISVSKEYLMISTLFYFFLGQLFIFRNTLQGMGDALIPLIASIAELLIRSFAAVYLAVKFSYYGIFWSGPIAWVGASLIVSIGYFATIGATVKKARVNIQMQRKAAQVLESC